MRGGMLNITQSQYQALADVHRTRALERLCALVRARSAAAAALPEERLQAAVAQGVDDAGAYGVVHEASVGEFLLLQAEYGRGFEDYPALAWAKAILLRGDLDGRLKMERVLAGLEHGPAAAEPVLEEG